jgi:NAD(P)-dependent dehydrogenase (short-subunit alcohol dehydrogenase family)
MNKVVLITGISTGFGRTSAESLARRGYSVIATMRESAGRNRSSCEELQLQARREGWSLQVLEMDVTNDVSVNEAAAQALEKWGRIDVVINNAGIGAVSITEAFTLEQFQRVLDLNLLGVVRVNRRTRRRVRFRCRRRQESLRRTRIRRHCARNAWAEIVVDSFVRLNETPPGQRPFRTVPTKVIQPLLQGYNAAGATLTETVAEMFGVSESTAVRSAHATS